MSILLTLNKFYNELERFSSPPTHSFRTRYRFDVISMSAVRLNYPTLSSTGTRAPSLLSLSLSPHNASRDCVRKLILSRVFFPRDEKERARSVRVCDTETRVSQDSLWAKRDSLHEIYNRESITEPSLGGSETRLPRTENLNEIIAPALRQPRVNNSTQPAAERGWKARLRTRMDFSAASITVDSKLIRGRADPYGQTGVIIARHA